VPVVLIGRAFGPDFCLRRIEKLATKYSFEKSEFVAVMVSGHYSWRERIDRHSFENYCMVEFEGRQLNVPVGYHRYLTNLYGDYMQPPPEDKRESKHHFEAYWK
jgi:lipopolysaccharide cholinephosphotransferase